MDVGAEDVVGEQLYHNISCDNCAGCVPSQTFAHSQPTISVVSVKNRGIIFQIFLLVYLLGYLSFDVNVGNSFQTY